MEAEGLVERCGSTVDGRGVVCKMTERGDLVLRNVAPTHVMGVRDYVVDLVEDEDLAALGRVMDAVADRLISDHPEREMRDDR
jgi:DNA-binding MarR family transcriptional regulator